jgi:hypothetical protein
MNNYYPDRWVLVKITTSSDAKPYYKVFGSWSGGWCGSDSWKMNSGINGVSFKDNCFNFSGLSGSNYICHAQSYGTNLYSHGVLNSIIEQGATRGFLAEVLDENTDFLGLDFTRD